MDHGNSQWQFWNHARLTRLSLAILISVVFAVLIVHLSSESRSRSFIKGGDFSQFYSLAYMAKQKIYDHLYDRELQRKMQNGFDESMEGSYMPMAYPPFVAVLYRPLASFPYDIAHIIYTALMFVCSLWALYICSVINVDLKRNFSTFCILSLLFAPVMGGVFGGQNVAISMLLYAGALWQIGRGTRWGEVYAGICIGLWLFKPSYGVLAALVCFCSLRRWLIIGILIPAIAYYCIGVSILGYDWPLVYADLIKKDYYWEILTSNGHQLISIAGTLLAFNSLFGDLLNAGLINTFSSVLSGILLLIVAHRFFTAGKLYDNRRRALALQSAMFLLGPVLLLGSASANFYDLGILIIAATMLIDFEKDFQVWFLLAAWFVYGLLSIFRDSIPVPLYFVLPVVVLGKFFAKLQPKATLLSEG